MSDVEAGIRWAITNNARVINMSLGVDDTACTSDAQAAVDQATKMGIVVVAAAGNGHRPSAAMPSNCVGVLSVAATDSHDAKASFSDYGTNTLLAAPGVNVEVAVNPNVAKYATKLSAPVSGTSIAAPHVAGVAALLFGNTSGCDAQSVISRIESTAVHIAGTGTLYKWGRVNARLAVGAGCRTPTPTPIVTPTPTVTPTATVTPTLGPLLGAPLGLAVKLTAGPPQLAQLDWDVLPNAAHYLIYRGDATGQNKQAIAWSNTTTFVDPNSPSGQTVTYWVAPPAPPTPVLPAPPTLTAALKSPGVSLTLSSNLSGVKFYIYRRDANYTTTLLGPVAASKSHSPVTYQDNSAPVGQILTYWAIAQSAVGTGRNSNVVSITIPPKVAPPTGIVVPVITGALSTRTGISLAWRYTGAGAPNGFTVHRTGGTRSRTSFRRARVRSSIRT